ncbi:predicted protein [Chaetomium globosum CBS 148.51]|uniref:Mid2 domain-containing protein n=1 Tax=Chaetomium globosum (strain ATCC 6205 / CBS 148.51 / DSM 1962 / NBRC 6347 / NRRL 1970) TaxID=306901 RepID=Q2H825_CHAGB|nr:uncharacterized protein CHGG_03629 [Chaetomium globosum CBS 148.51]EAQ91694.1 predicted protein [Chaetomium globosum CBS 148.51]
MAVPRLGALRRMVAALAGLPFISLLLLNPSFLVGTNAQLIDCYKWDGTIAANNTRCPGSNACCGPGAVCLSNRLCTSDGNPNSKAKLVRGPCAVNGWDDSCPQICTYKEGKLFPRVGTCEDGSLCCDDDPDCCKKGLGIFLDESGNRISTRGTAYTTRYPPTAGGASRYTLMPSSDASSSTSTNKAAASTTKTPSTTKTSTPNPSHSTSDTATSQSTTDGETSRTSTPSNSDDASKASSDSSAATTSSDNASEAISSRSDNSLGLKIGLGFGIPASILATAVVMYFWLGRRGHRAAGDATAERTSEVAPYQPASFVSDYHPQMPPPMYGNPYAVELGGHNPSEMMAHTPPVQQHFLVPSTPKLQ